MGPLLLARNDRQEPMTSGRVARIKAERRLVSFDRGTRGAEMLTTNVAELSIEVGPRAPLRATGCARENRREVFPTLRGAKESDEGVRALVRGSEVTLDRAPCDDRFVEGSELSSQDLCDAHAVGSPLFAGRRRLRRGE